MDIIRLVIIALPIIFQRTGEGDFNEQVNVFSRSRLGENVDMNVRVFMLFHINIALRHWYDLRHTNYVTPTSQQARSHCICLYKLYL